MASGLNFNFGRNLIWQFTSTWVSKYYGLVSTIFVLLLNGVLSKRIHCQPMDKKYLAYQVPIFASQGGTYYQYLKIAIGQN